MSGQQTSPDSGASRRRSPRIPAQVPLEVLFEGESLEGRTAVVSRHGALILCAANCSEHALLDVTNQTTREKVSCRVVWCGNELIAGERRLGIEMTEDRPRFWGIDFASARGLEPAG